VVKCDPGGYRIELENLLWKRRPRRFSLAERRCEEISLRIVYRFILGALASSPPNDSRDATFANPMRLFAQSHSRDKARQIPHRAHRQI
jgi:hypothetical protein